MTLTGNRTHGTRRSEPNQNIYRGRTDESFDCELPPEARIELEEPHRPPPPAYRAPSEVPQAPPRRIPRAIWIAILVILSILYMASRNNGPSTSSTREESRPVPAPLLAPQPVEVRRALSVDVRRALPAVPRALPVNAVLPTVLNATGGQWQPIRMPDGTILPVSYQGDLAGSAALPSQGRFIGEEWSTGATSWVWMTPAGAAFPSWVDP